MPQDRPKFTAEELCGLGFAAEAVEWDQESQRKPGNHTKKEIPID
jgi:hypothetical protein